MTSNAAPCVYVFMDAGCHPLTFCSIRTDVFAPRQDLFTFIVQHVPEITDGSILVVTSKLLSLAQDRRILRSEISKPELVRREADRNLGSSFATYLTIKDGILIPAAGVDESNANEHFILWPVDPFGAAQSLWQKLRSHFGITQFGVVFSDSRSTPLRRGVSGVSVAHWGFRATQNHVGRPDIFGRPIGMSVSNVADGLVSASILLMGESNEQRPLVLIQHFAAEFCDVVDPKELVVAPEDDIFSTLFAR